jgi:hypothetical protein
MEEQLLFDPNIETQNRKAILEASRKQIREGDVLSHEEF